MPINPLAGKALEQAFAQKQLGPVSSPSVKSVSNRSAPISKPAAFARVLQQGQALPQAQASELAQQIEKLSPEQLRASAKKTPLPLGLARVLETITGVSQSPLAQLSDTELVATLMRGEDGQGQRYTQILRNAQELENSGILQDLQELSRRQISVPASELNRSIADDAVLVLQDFAKLSATEIAAKKEAAYAHPEVVRDQPAAIAKRYYGSEQHKQYGVLVEQLTGGIISAEEAMAMNPTGGIPGPGAKEVPLVGRSNAVLRHAMRHDATGFLLTRFGVGPGYGSPTTPLGLNHANPLAGQVLGIAREVFGESSVLPESSHAARPERFNSQPRQA